MDNLTLEQRKRNMKNIKSANTKAEILFRKKLWSKGIRYRINVQDVFGKPDICIKKKKLAIFIDSEFWHGKNYLNGKIPKTNQEYWISKFKRNIERDHEVNKVLNEQGWKIYRFWIKDIEKNLDKLVDQVVSYLKKKS